MKYVNMLKFAQFPLVLFLFVIGSVVAVGFHTADEVLPGTFSTGDFSFDGDLGIGDPTPSYPLDVVGIIRGDNLILDDSTSCGKLYTDASGNVLCGVDATGAGGTVTGSGSANYVAIWNSSGLTDDESLFYDPSTNSLVIRGVSVDGSLALDVNGQVGAGEYCDHAGNNCFNATDVGGAQNLFSTFDTPSGTDPVADTTTDTVTFTASGAITITGNSATDTITFDVTEVDGSTTNELQDLWDVFTADSGSTTANSQTDTLTIAGGTGISTSISGDTLTITSSVTDTDNQNLFQTFNAPSGTDPVADDANDTLNFAAGSGITITGDSSSDTITIAATGGSGSQNLYQTFNAPSGTDPVADDANDTINLAASGIVTITGDSSTDTLTIAATEVDGSTTNELQDLWDVISADSGSTTANSQTDTLTIAGGTGISTSIVGDTLTISSSGGSGSQLLFQTFDTPSGTDPVADDTNDTVTFAASGAITITGNSATDTITFDVTEVDGSTTNELQDLWDVFTADSGSTTANSQTDTLTIAGGTGISTSISGDTLTITSSVTDTDNQNLFQTFNVPSGTDPVADDANDTLNFAAGSGITITGDSSSDTITIASTVSAGVTGAGTLGRLAFWNATDQITDASNLYWDSGTSRLGVGVASPAGRMHVNESGNEFKVNSTGVTILI